MITTTYTQPCQNCFRTFVVKTCGATYSLKGRPIKEGNDQKLVKDNFNTVISPKIF